MPSSAFALVGLFAAISVIAGAAVTAAIGPRRPLAAVLPALGAFGALYLAGHRLGLVIGPNLPILGFEVALLGDALIALVAALAAAVVQREQQKLEKLQATRQNLEQRLAELGL